MKTVLSCLLLSLLTTGSIAVAQTGPTGADGDPAAIRQLVYDMEQAYGKVSDYTAIFHKREVVKGKLLPEETVFMKFRKPFSVYMKWIKDPKKNQETLFVKGWNDNKLRAHPGKFPDVTVNLSPTGSLAMKDNRHTIVEAGLGHTIELITRDFRRGEQRPEDQVRFIDHGTAAVYGVASRCVEAVMPKRPDSGYYAYRAKICGNTATGLPNRVTIWDHTDTMIEDYGYEDLKINVGLTDKDFDPENPEYNF